MAAAGPPLPPAAHRRSHSSTSASMYDTHTRPYTHVDICYSSTRSRYSNAHRHRHFGATERLTEGCPEHSTFEQPMRQRGQKFDYWSGWMKTSRHTENCMRHFRWASTIVKPYVKHVSCATKNRLSIKNRLLIKIDLEVEVISKIMHTYMAL